MDLIDIGDLTRDIDGKKTYSELEEENRELRESLDIATKCSSKEEDGIIRLSEENKKLNERIEELEQCNLNLQRYMDKQDKENKKLKEEVGKYRSLDGFLMAHGINISHEGDIELEE